MARLPHAILSSRDTLIPLTLMLAGRGGIVLAIHSNKSASSMTHINVGVDSNILLHFGNVENLKWNELFPDSSSVTVFICAQVQKEIDSHKGTVTGYMHNRTREYQKILRSAEANADYRYRSNINIGVEFVFLDRPRDSELDDQAFDLTEPDSRIVAQLLHASDSGGLEMIMVANDARPIRVARQHGMKAVRPDAWEQVRTELESPATMRLRAENKELRERLSAHPNTVLARLEEQIEHRIFAGFDSHFDPDTFFKKLKAKLLKCHGLQTPESVARQHDVVADPWGFDIPRLGKVSMKDINNYAEEISVFTENIRELDAAVFYQLIENLALIGSFAMVLANQGTKPDESVSVELAFVSEGNFIDPEALHDSMKLGLEVPSPPAPLMTDFSSFADQLATRHGQDHEFVDVSNESGGRTKRYLCKRFQHGTEKEFFDLFLSADPNTPSAIEITVRAHYLPTPIVRRVHVLPVPTHFSEPDVLNLLREAHRLMPPEQSELLRRAVAEFER
ncbi:PIN domain-containing protein [Mesorhizobium sp. M0025]|uniref:PIN domain-containing protein n=1 Tax=Mesorhizobium sp. M0025 TaxID=2956846 RepID=UPI003338885F